MIEADALTVTRGGHPVVALETLTLDAELIAIMGPNGAGKTTLLEALAGRLPYEGTVDAGDVWLTGTDPPTPTLVRVEALVAGHGAKTPDRWLDAVGYEGPANLAHGSSGERMLVALAGALGGPVGDLLFDEPFGHLDPPHVARLIPLMRERAGEDAVVFTTHDPLAAARADRVLLLNHHIVADGSPRDVLQPGPLSDCYEARLEVEWTRLGPVVQASDDASPPGADAPRG